MSSIMRLFCLCCRMFPMSLAGVEEFLASQVLRTLFFLTEKDYPPVARAGNDVVIVLPVDHVVLYGNGSTDDKVQKGPILDGFAGPGGRLSSLFLNLYWPLLQVALQ